MLKGTTNKAIRTKTGYKIAIEPGVKNQHPHLIFNFRLNF